MKIIINESSLFCRDDCCLCGNDFDREGALALAFNDDDDTNDREKSIGRVCLACIEAGPDGIKRRAQEAADAVAESARRAQGNADHLQRETITVPKPSEFELTIERVMVRQFGGTREQLREQIEAYERRTGVQF